jgi:hypothetical protein
MNSPRLFFDIYKTYANYKDVADLVVLEINDTGKLSSQMWKQLFTKIHVENDLSKVGSCEFDICFLNITDWSKSEQILSSLNYSPRPRGHHEIIVANKAEFWQYFLPSTGPGVCQRAKLWGGEQDTRQFSIRGDMGLFPYKIKKPDQTVVAESKENEATVLWYS